MRSVVLAAVGSVLTVAGFARAEDDRKVVAVFDERGLTVRVLVKERAKPSDAGWLALEFVNGSKDPLTVTNAYYRIEAEYDDLAMRKRCGSGGLASGNSFDLFPKAWETTPVAPIVLKPGEPYQAVDQPSDYSTALLCPRVALFGASSGLGIRAALHLRLEVEGGRAWETPQEGAPFAFDWLPVDDADVAAMRRRLVEMLGQPSRYFHQVYLLHAYLDFPGVADGVTRDQLLAAMERRTDGSAEQGREVIAGHLGKRFGADPGLRDYYLRALEAGDAAAVGDLLRPGELWSPSFVAPLAELFTTDPDKYSAALLILHRHRLDWAADEALARRLSAAVLVKCPRLREVADVAPEQLSLWAMDVSLLAQTGDKAMIASLEPALDDARSYARLERMSFTPGMCPPPTRVCDAALDAILTLLDGDSEAAYKKAGLCGGSRVVRDSEVAAKVRDGMIAELKKRLKEH